MKMTYLEACKAIQEDPRKSFVTQQASKTYRLRGTTTVIHLIDDETKRVLSFLPFEVLDASWLLDPLDVGQREDVADERPLILQLALQEAHRKKDELEGELNDTEQRHHRRAFVAGVSTEEKKRFDRDVAELKENIKGWEETLSVIREWRASLA